MSKPKWTAFPHPSKAYAYPGDALKKHWADLHRGDCEPWPKDEPAREAWRLFHEGRFAEAVVAGLKAGSAGQRAANKAQVVYAQGIEKKPAQREALLAEAMQRAERQAAAEPKDACSQYIYAFAAGRYSQTISVARALTQGYGGKIRAALDAALRLEPKLADAHLALGAWHSEIIDKVGPLVGGLTYGAKKEAAEEHFRKALKLAPDAPVTRLQYADGLVMLHGKKKLEEAGRLYGEAAAMKARDAMERLDVELAKSELE